MKYPTTTPGNAAGEELAAARSTRVGVVQVGLVRDPGVEVVAVLRAADARPAVAVGHGDERRLPVQPLDRQQRAHARAPAALALAAAAAGEAPAMTARRAARRSPARCGRTARGGADGDEEHRDRPTYRRVSRSQAGGGRAAGDAEHARDLVGGRQRADVAPQPGATNQTSGSSGTSTLPPQVEAGAGVGHEQGADGQRDDDGRDPQAAPDRARERVSDLGEVGERVDGTARAHQPTPSSISSVRKRSRSETILPRSNSIARASSGWRPASASNDVQAQPPQLAAGRGHERERAAPAVEERHLADHRRRVERPERRAGGDGQAALGQAGTARGRRRRHG